MSETNLPSTREERIAALPAHLRDRLRARLAGAAAPDAAEAGPGALRPVPRDRRLPMSFAQQRMWFLYEFDPDAVGYNSCFALRLRGELDAPALRRAVNDVVARHESLRTTFDVVDGEPVQIPHPQVRIPMPVTSVAGGTRQERDDEVLRLVTEEAGRPFDLRVGPLLRTVLLRLAEDEHVLVLSIHHIVHDGWSLALFTRELAVCYQAAATGGAADLPVPEVQYPDFSVWQRERLSGGMLDEALAYWRKQLDGLPALELPTDRPRPAAPSGAGGVHEFTVPAPVVAGLRKLAEDSAATLFMALTAATQLLLARLARQEDIAVGTPVAGRGEPELEQMIGLFLNTLVLRGQVDPHRSFREFLAEARETILDAFSHEEVPFERVVDAVQPERDPSRMPLAQVLVVLQNMPEAVLDLPGLTVEQLTLPQASTGFDLVLAFEERPDGTLWAALEYSADLFDDSTVRRIAEHLGVLLTSIVGDPDAPLGGLNLLTPEEYTRVTRDWARNPHQFPEQEAVHRTVARRAAERPDALAVVRGDQRLSYAELDRRAALLADLLRTSGVRGGDVVGVCCERGPDQVAATLAVLKSGAAFLPLNPQFPVGRRELMLAETDARFVLTQGPLAADFSGSAAKAIVLDEQWPLLDGGRPAELPDGADEEPDRLAYIVYTSGSTGTPKGVLLGHRGLTNMINASRRKLGTGPGHAVLQLSSASFDGAIWETFVALTSGAVLVMPDSVSDGLDTDVVRAMAAGRPTVLSLPPAALAAVDPEALPDGSVVLAVGDRCPTPLALTWARRHRFINGYGPTENTVGATMHEVDAAEDATGRLSVGRPLPNVEVYLLDPFGQPVPTGVTGEIHLGGHGVAHGYLNRADLTRQRFVPHPFSDDPGARLYRTGDLAGWRPDGRIDFRGRADDQVKIRGFRVEPGEIEAAMLRHPGVDRAAVVVREDDRGKHLVGYLVPAADGRAGTAEVRDFLARELPAFLVPASLVALRELPLTANGKVDRDALPEPDPVTTGSAVPPSGPVETALAELFTSVLGVAGVGAEDDFFDLGGDSILSTQLVARARQAGLAVTARDVFRQRTVARLAETVRAAAHDGPDDREADDRYRTGPVPLTPIQGWFFDHHTVNPHHFNQSLMLDLVPAVDREAVRAALAALVEHHDMLRARYTRDGAGRWSQEVLPAAAGSLSFERLDLAREAAGPDERTVDEAVRQAQRALHLTDGPLLRAVLFDFGARRPPRLFLTAHHLVVDGVSWRILLDDLCTAYADTAAGRPVRLAARTTSFGQWAHRLRDHTLAGGFEDEHAHWRSLPAAAQPAATGLFGSTRTVREALGEADTDLLLRRVPGALRARVDEVLLGALAQGLGAAAQEFADGVVVDLEGHGREDILDGVDLSRTVGWFTTVHPVRLDVPTDLPPAAAVRAVKRQLRAVPGRGIGYGALRHWAPGTGDAAALPGPGARISFNYLGQWDARLPGGDHLVLGFADHGGGDHEPGERRPYALDFSAAVEGGRLELSCTYSPELHDEAEAAALLRSVTQRLGEVIRSCA